MSTYRALLARPGARALALACGLGWLSFGSYGLAVVLAVHAASGSFAASGAAVAAFSAGSGLLAPVRGRFVDARGPRALGLFAPVHAAGLALLVLGCAGGWGSAALAGGPGGGGGGGRRGRREQRGARGRRRRGGRDLPAADRHGALGLAGGRRA